MNELMLAAGAATGLGIALVVRGMAPPEPPLAQILAGLHRPPAPPTAAATTTAEEPAWGWLARLGRPAARWLAHAGLPTRRTRRDLDLLERPAAVHLAEQAACAVLGAALAPAVTAVLALGGLPLPIAVPAWGCLALAAAGAWTPVGAVRSQATARRHEFTQALGAFLDLIVIGLAGGAGVDAAITEASRIGHGWAFDRIRRTLHSATITRTPIWTALTQLGHDLDIPTLREVAAAVALAGTEGAKVRTSLAAKASALRLRQLTDAEADAVAATEQMSLPVILMFAGFLIFIGFPAVLHVFMAI